MRKFLLCLATFALSAFVAFADGYITSVKLPDGETRQFRDDSAWGQIESITQSISSIDFTSANTTLVATIHSQAPAPGNYAAVSNAAFYSSNRVETAVQTSDLTTITSAVINAATDAATSIADNKFIPSESPDSSGRKASWNNGSFELGDDFSGEFSPSIGYDIDSGVLSTYSWTGFGWIRDSYWNSLQDVLDEKTTIDDVDSIITQVVPEWAMSETKPTYTASEVGSASEYDFNYVSNQVSEIASNYITAAYISATNTVFSNAVVAVGLNIDTNLISALENYNAISNAAYYASNRVDSATLTNAYPATFVPETAQTGPYYLADTALMISNKNENNYYQYAKLDGNLTEVGIRHKTSGYYDTLTITRGSLVRGYVNGKYSIYIPEDSIYAHLGTVDIWFPRTGGTLATTNILSAVATTGNYADLTNTPMFAAVATNGQYSSLIGTPTEWPWSEISGKPAFADVATNGLYSSLIGTPTEWAWSKISGKPVFEDVATNGLYSSLKGTPNLAPIATSGNYNDLTNTPTFASVAYSGSYTDLIGTPTTWAWSNISGKPNFATVATTGSYNDLLSTPNLDAVATSGDYDDLKNKPTKLSEFENDEGFATTNEVTQDISALEVLINQRYESLKYPEYVIGTNENITIRGDKKIFVLSNEVEKSVNTVRCYYGVDQYHYVWNHLKSSDGKSFTYKTSSVALAGVPIYHYSQDGGQQTMVGKGDNAAFPGGLNFKNYVMYPGLNTLISYDSNGTEIGYVKGFNRNTLDNGGSVTIQGVSYFASRTPVPYGEPIDCVATTGEVGIVSKSIVDLDKKAKQLTDSMEFATNRIESLDTSLTSVSNKVETIDRIHGENGTYLKADLKVYSSNGVVVVDIATWAAITNWVEQNFQRK